MPLSIKDVETERLARELAHRTGQSITSATRHALAEQLRRLDRGSGKSALREDLANIRSRWKAWPKKDLRSAEDIIGYDDNGIPC